jgi:hypothetical protein
MQKKSLNPNSCFAILLLGTMKDPIDSRRRRRRQILFFLIWNQYCKSALTTTFAQGLPNVLKICGLLPETFITQIQMYEVGNVIPFPEAVKKEGLNCSRQMALAKDKYQRFRGKKIVQKNHHHF